MSEKKKFKKKSIVCIKDQIVRRIFCRHIGAHANDISVETKQPFYLIENKTMSTVTLDFSCVSVCVCLDREQTDAADSRQTARPTRNQRHYTAVASLEKRRGK